MKSKFFTAKNVAFLAILVALVVVLQLFASAVPMFGITLNFSLVPIALAGILLGVRGGLIVGFASGLVTYITCAIMGMEPSTAYLFQTSPVLLTVTCLGKTTLAGLVAGLLYRPIAAKNKIVGSYVSSLSVPVVNTGIYMLGIVLMKSDVAAFLGLTESTANAVFVAVFALIWLNFILEIVVTIILTPAVHFVVNAVERNFKNKK